MKRSLSLMVFLLVSLLWIPSSQAALSSSATAALNRCNRMYKASKWKAALKACGKAWEESSSNPHYERLSIQLYTGMTLYRMGRKPLAWKAFESVLTADPHVLPPASSPSDLKSFFDRVKKRHVKRTGVSLKQLPRAPSAGGTPRWLVPGILIGAGLAFVTTGALLMANSGSINGQYDSLTQNATAAGMNKADMDKALNPLRNDISLHGTLGVTSLGLGGAAVVGGVVLYFLSGPKRNAVASHIPLRTPSRSRANSLLKVR